ncbi:MAG: hypothetical protein RL563_2671 [Pseudomonadota bacterium]|jgi:hypothetical protein
MTRDDIIRMGQESGFQIGPSRDGPDDVWGTGASLERFAALIADAEREEIIDLVAFHGGSVEIEAAIRARRQS